MFSVSLFQNKEWANPVKPSHVVWVPDVDAVLFMLEELEFRYYPNRN